jgi:hypothetical protein
MTKQEAIQFIEEFVERGCEILGVESPFEEGSEETD